MIGRLVFDEMPAGWFVIDVMRLKSRSCDWTALMTDTHPDEDDPHARIFARQCWVRIPGKHRNRDAAWDMLEAMAATRH
ncbi:hypothetical protein [Mesorhizobium argentiipisi]|uniref:Transposase n=1 Tax=Mesorhizobium argentiipisi TaxID=3015175 RepID=A0ABU8KEF4_9HYPH